MNHRGRVWQVISDLAARLDSISADGLKQLEKQVSKLGREQYRANTLAQTQSERLQAVLEALQSAVARQEAAQQEAVQKAKLDVLKSLLPVLDGLEAGLKSGGRHAYRLHLQGSPEAGTLIAWLDGQRLLRDRLLALLNKEGIEPIPSIGQPFDPYRHVAVSTVKDESLPNGQIVAEEQRGYAAGDQVLRYAQVVVVRNKSKT